MYSYSSEEFAERLKRRGITGSIAEARKYVKHAGKPVFTEQDFEEAYHVLNAEPVGRSFIRVKGDECCVYYKRDYYGTYSAFSVAEI